jgi:hypothetical protein
MFSLSELARCLQNDAELRGARERIGMAITQLLFPTSQHFSV